MDWKKAGARALAVLGTLLLGLTVVIEVVDDDGPGGKPPHPRVTIITTTVDGNSEVPGVQPVTVQAPAPVVNEIGVHEGMSQGDAATLPFPSAAPSQRGCDTRTVRNMSSRGGTAVREIVLHYTVGPNRVGLSDMDGTTTLANSPAAAVSWHFLVDREGHCYFSVPLTMKAWTQANANPFSVGIEIVNSGKEPNLIDGAGKAKLALVVSDTARKLDIPLGVGRVVNCQPAAPGVVDHFSLGPCGGGHFDLTPFGGGSGSSTGQRVGFVVAAAWRLRLRESTVWCARIHAFRNRRAAGDPATPTGSRLQASRLAKVRDRELSCVEGRPHRR